MNKICKKCGTKFITKYQHQKYCCQRCNNAKKYETYNKKRSILSGIGVCSGCNGKYQKQFPEQLFCTSKCYSESQKYNRFQEKLIENYFERIDTPKKAYWLGFLYGDGYVSKNERNLQLILAEEDESVIDDFCTDVGLDMSCKKYYGPYASNKQRQVHIRICNKKFVSFLVALGCINKKSNVVRLPKIDFPDAFLLGLYDADGTAGTSLITGGSEKLFEDIKIEFNIDNQISHPSGCFILRIGTVLLRNIFDKYDFGLNRKRFIGGMHSRLDKRHNNHIRNNQRKFNPTPVQLKDKLIELQYNFCAVGRFYGVSDNAIRKRCKLCEISI